MYVNPFLAGIIVTLLVEFAVIIVVAVVDRKKGEKR